MTGAPVFKVIFQTGLLRNVEMVSKVFRIRCVYNCIISENEFESLNWLRWSLNFGMFQSPSEACNF